MYITKEIRLGVFIASGLLMLAGCFSQTVPDQSVAAQTNQNSNQANQTNKVDNQTVEPEILKGVTELCRQYSIDLDLTPNDSPDYRLYQLVNFGFPKEVSIEEAVAVYNKSAQCSDWRKAELPLRKEEVIAAIRAWKCESEADFDDRKKACAEFRKLADIGKMPKGSLIETGSLGVENNLGYDVEMSAINLSIRLDKYPHSLADVPLFFRVIRFTYTSSKPTEHNKQNRRSK